MKVRKIISDDFVLATANFDEIVDLIVNGYEAVGILNWYLEGKDVFMDDPVNITAISLIVRTENIRLFVDMKNKRLDLVREIDWYTRYTPPYIGAKPVHQQLISVMSYGMIDVSYIDIKEELCNEIIYSK